MGKDQANKHLSGTQKGDRGSAGIESDVYSWDYFSDQPYPIKDKQAKRNIRRKALPSIIRMTLVSIIHFPGVFFRYLMYPRFSLQRKIGEAIGLCVNLDKSPEQTVMFVEELGVRNLAIRVPLSDIENIDDYRKFAERFEGHKILFVVLQDRPNIENPELMEANIRRIFTELSPLGSKFQIGNAINRTKWGFISVDEYFGFFRVAQELAKKEFPDLVLYGAPVIDFEIYAFMRSLWHGSDIKYDGVAAQLYVDRRGAPENRQFVFDLVGKINFIWAAIVKSSRSGNSLLITEANWPIKDTKPYAPALGDVWVDEESYANFMIRYFLLALANGKAECIYWHQLLAPGYGLIDNREGDFRKRKAYFMFRFLVRTLKESTLVEVVERKSVIQMRFEQRDGDELRIIWSVRGEHVEKIASNTLVTDACGAEIEVVSEIKISEEPVYFFRQSGN